jgi:hypothetical protein
MTAVDTLPPSAPLRELTAAESLYLERRPAVLAALENVTLAKTELAQALADKEEASKRHKGKEAALELAWEALEAAERGAAAASVPTPLFDNGNAAPDPLAIAAWDQQWAKFLAKDIDAGLPDLDQGIVSTLSAARIDTIGQLCDVKRDNPTAGYTSIDGIGEAKADAIDKAYDAALAEFLRVHPNPRPRETPAAESPAVDPGSIDFVGVFPSPLSQDPGESFDAAYHKTVIDGAVEALHDIRRDNASIATGTKNGKKLTDKQIEKLRSAVAETELNYNEGFAIYAEKFGKIAADKLRAHVEAQVDQDLAAAPADAELRGGLEA